MSNNQFKFTPTEVVLLLIIVVLINIRSLVPSNQTNNLEPLKEYIKSVNNNGDETVVLFSSGNMYDENNQLLYFRHKVVISILEKVLSESNISLVTINTECLGGEPECVKEFVEIAEAIASINPKSILYIGIDSGIAVDKFANIIAEEEIPIYTSGTEVEVKEKIYVGPDNEGLGRVAFEGLENEISSSDRVIYLETVEGDPAERGSTILDNGYPRINSVRTKLENIGVQTQNTLFTNWSRGTTYNVLKEEIKSNGVPDYIIAPSLETAEGAVEALRDLEDEKNNIKTKIVVLDFSNIIKEMLKKEEIYAAVSQDLIGQAVFLASSVSENKNFPYSKELFVGKFITRETLALEKVSTLW